MNHKPPDAYEKVRRRVIEQREEDDRLQQFVLAGRIPVFARDGEHATAIATITVDTSQLFAVLRRRLLANDRLSGLPLWHIVNSMPGVHAGMSSEKHAAAFERAINSVVVAAALAVIGGFATYATGSEAKTVDALIESALQAAVTTLRFCTACGRPFRFGRRAKKHCGTPDCHRLAKPRQERPGHAAVMSARRQRQLLADAINVRSRSGASVTTDALKQLLDQTAAGSLAAQRQLAMLAEKHPLFESIEYRATRYQRSRTGKRPMPR